MLHGRVVRPPAVGATLVSVDESSVQDLPGVVKVVVKKNFVGVVAEKPWQAIQAAEQVESRLDPRPRPAQASELLRAPAQSESRRATRCWSIPRTSSRNSRAAATVRQGHLSTIPTRCTDRWEVPAPSPTCRATRPRSGRPPRRLVSAHPGAMILGLKPENVHVIFRRGSGCYGFNGADTVTYDAALLSQAVGKPVRVQLSRKDEMAWENYGNAFVHRRARRPGRAGQYRRLGSRSLVSRPRQPPGSDHSGKRDHRNAGRVRTRAHSRPSPAPAPAEPYSNNSNGVPSYMAGQVGGDDSGHGNGQKRARAAPQRRLSFLDRSAALARSAFKTLSRTNASWTNWPPRPRPIPSHSACAI